MELVKTFYGLRPNGIVGNERWVERTPVQGGPLNRTYPPLNFAARVGRKKFGAFWGFQSSPDFLQELTSSLLTAETYEQKREGRTQLAGSR